MSEEIQEQSMLLAQAILDRGDNLRNDDVRVNYNKRDDYLRNLVGEQGYITFTPKITEDIAKPIRDLLLPELEMASNAHRNASLYTSDREILKKRLNLISKLTNDIESSDLLANTIPLSVSQYIKDYEIKDFKSPKLSKFLVHLFGEKHEVVKWYTCTCPKTMQFGELDEYRLTVSILPHHIAGMSYYGSLNWGGEPWESAHAGTSCCDPIRNNGGEGLYTLAASLQEETLAIAYLSLKKDINLLRPVYQARVLLRICFLNDDTPILIACRVFGTNKTTKHMILDGLNNHFGNVHSTNQMRKFRSEDDQDSDSVVKINRKYTTTPFFRLQPKQCRECGGTGTRQIGWENVRTGICPHCENGMFTGKPILPYIDDRDVIYMEENEVTFVFPKEYLEKEGLPYEAIQQQEESETTI